MLSLVNTKCEPLPSVWNRDAVLIKKKKKTTATITLLFYIQETFFSTSLIMTVVITRCPRVGPLAAGTALLSTRKGLTTAETIILGGS